MPTHTGDVGLALPPGSIGCLYGIERKVLQAFLSRKGLDTAQVQLFLEIAHGGRDLRDR